MPRPLARAAALLLCAGPLARGLLLGGGEGPPAARRGPARARGPPDRDLPEHNATEALARLEAALARTWAEPPAQGRARYVVWRGGGPGGGWGNRFRGLTAALLLSLATGRRFLVDHSAFFEAFEDPGGAGVLDYREMAASLRGLPERLLPFASPAYRRPLSLSQREVRLGRGGAAPGARGAELLQWALRSGADVLVHQCGCSFVLELLQSRSEAVRRAVRSVFGSHREDALVEVVVRYLTRRPRQLLAKNAGLVLRSWQHQAYDGFAMVQDRQWTDVAERDRDGKERSADRPHLNCTYKRLEAYKATLPGAQRLLIGVTSDSASYTETLLQTFAPLGDVRRNRLFTDNALSYEATQTPLAARQFVVDWYVLGLAPFVVCTGSTYCLSARASRGLGNDGAFPYASGRRTYRQGGPFCYGRASGAADQLGIDTLSHPTDGRVFW